MANVPFFRGENVTLKIYQSNSRVVFPGKSFSVEQNATEVADGVNGENRDRLDIVTNSFSGSVDIYQADQTVMNALLAAQTAHDAQGLPLPQHGAVEIRQRDGIVAVYLMTEMVLGPWTNNASGRSDAVMLTLKFRFREWKPMQSVI